jgi:hypothetical protein
MGNRSVEKVGEISMEQIIASIRNTRNNQIDELMKEPVLMGFLELHFDTLAISNVKKLFLFKDLMELRNTQLDLSHYSSLLTQMKELQTLTADSSNKLFLTELNSIFQKYVSKVGG